MSSLSNIRNRLHAVKNIEQIATSMEMVASARFRKAQDRAKQTRFYVTKMQEILEKICAASVDLEHPLFKQREEKKIGLVIVSSDRGLCGAYNTNIFAAADKFVSEKKDKTELIVLGRKGLGYYQQRKQPIYKQLTGWSGKLTFLQIQEFSDFLLEAFLKKELDSVWLLYTKFYTLMHREIVLEKFLPIGKPEKGDRKSLNYLFEPNLEEILNEILPRYCIAKIESILNEAYASELAARIFSMKAAAKNAEEMLEALTLERNKMRQAGITREILETISSG